MGDFVTGPNATRKPALVWLSPRLRTAGMRPRLYTSWPLNPMGNLFGQDMGVPEGPVPFGLTGVAGERSKSYRRPVRRGMQLWNDRAAEQGEGPLFRETHDKREADVRIEEGSGKFMDKQGVAGWSQDVWKTWSEDEGTERIEPYNSIDINPNFVQGAAGPQIASLAAHELGHSQGLGHHHGSPKPGVMRYEGDPGGARNKPTPQETTKAIRHENTGQGASTNRQNMPAKTKPKKPAHERKVTGSHKVMQ